MALFLDSANIDDVHRAVELGFVAGVTTNPGLVAETGRSAIEIIHDGLGITTGPVFFQVTANLGSCSPLGARGHPSAQKCGRDCLGDVLVQIVFVHPAKRTDEVAQAGPNAFHCVAVCFAHTIAIVIPSPLALAWRVSHAGMGAPTFGQMVVRLPFIGVHGGRIPRAFFDEGLERLPISVLADFQTNLTTLTPDDARDRWPIIVPDAIAF
jgi:hypothetical protein